MILVNSKAGEVEVCKVFKFMGSLVGACFVISAFAAMQALILWV